MRVNDEITNRPRLVINEEIRGVANLAIQGLDMMAAHAVSAPQMVIPFFLMPVRFFPLITVTHFTVAHKIRISSPTVGAAPIRWVSIMSVVSLLELVGDGLVSVQRGTVLDLLFG